MNFRKYLLLLLILGSSIAIAEAQKKVSILTVPAGNEFAKIDPEGTTILPSGRFLTPAGDLISPYTLEKHDPRVFDAEKAMVRYKRPSTGGRLSSDRKLIIRKRNEKSSTRISMTMKRRNARPFTNPNRSI